MLPVNSGGHAAYQKLFLSQMRKYYPNPESLARSTWDIIERFWHLDLSQTDIIMKDRYSVFGPEPRLPSCMLRSYLLSIDFKVSSITDWAAQLKTNPLFAIVSGFEFGDTPGTGTFYDFSKRLWKFDGANLTPHIHPLKASIKKPKKKGQKAESVESLTVEELLQKMKASSFASEQQPYAILFHLYRKQFLDVSVGKGLIRKEHLSLSGDGTPVVTSARERRHRICECAEKNILDCNCSRYFSQPDCDIGWDSSRSCFYHGYDLYMLVASASESDLPIFPLLEPASRHDSLGFVHTFFSMRGMLPDFHPEKVILDSAHDAMPLYRYFKQEGITPFIDLNEKRGVKLKYKNDFTIGVDGVPVCRAGRKMNRDGKEVAKHRLKYRCPLASRKYGCSCGTPCSDSKHGRTVHLQMKDNTRLINIPPRDSPEWKKEYNARTSSERSNKRVKNDFLLESGRHRSSKMWYCRLYCIMMLQHLDAWDLPFESTLKKLILQVS